MGTSKTDEQRDAMYNPRNVRFKPQERSLEPRVNVMMIQNSAHFNTVMIANVLSRYCDQTVPHRRGESARLLQPVIEVYAPRIHEIGAALASAA
jgi:hypothetical protein